MLLFEILKKFDIDLKNDQLIFAVTLATMFTNVII